MKYFIIFFFIFVFNINPLKAQPGCPSVNAGPDQTLSCTTPCTNLTATVLGTGTTTTYLASSITYAPPYPYNTGTTILNYTDDLWSGVITLPFTFCFYGTAYTQIVAGSNGVISFGPNNANMGCAWSFTASIPNGGIIAGSVGPYVLAPYQDINPAMGGTMKYAILGSAPCRTFVVSWNAVPEYGCYNLSTTAQVVLYESTNVVEVYMQNKPICYSWNGGRAALGIQNQNGTLGIAPPGRNTGQWSATNEAWRFTPNGAPNYTLTWWLGGTQIGTGTTINVCPTSTTTYTAKVVYNLCTGAQLTLTDNVIVNVGTTMALAVNPASVSICNGNSTTLTASVIPPNPTFQWSNGSSGASITVTPATTTVYTVTATVPGCTATANVTVTVNPNPIVNISASVNPICAGSSTTLTPSGANTYIWSGGLGTSNPLTDTPLTTTTYTVTGTSSGCTGTSSITVNVNPNPVVSLSASDDPICEGSSSTLTATGASTYLWSGGLGSSNPLTVTPTMTTTYTVTGTSLGCTGTASLTITVNPLPIVTISSSANPVCFGTSPTLTANGANSYLWSGGLGTTNPLTITPATTTTYIVTGTSLGCTGTSSITITVNANPVVILSASPNPICSGFPTTLSAGGASTYTWSGGLGTSNPLIDNPLSTTTYTVTGTSLGCTGTASTTVNVNPNPTVSISASSTTICQGTSVNITAAGANSYLWSGGLGTLNPITVTPATTTTYTVTGTSLGCTGTASITITVNPNPAVTISPSASAICPGGSSTLTANGATTYIWSGGLGTINPLTVTPASTTTYTVTGTSLGCTGTSSITISVNSTPIISITPSSNPICQGFSTALTANGASTYLWSGGLGTANPLTVTPAMTTTYTVTGTMSGCTGSANIAITVNPNPVVSISASPNPICAGSSTTLTANGASSYLWGGGFGTLNPLTVTPASTTTYNVTGSTLGCIGTATITITVNPNPVVSISATANPICFGTSTTLTANGATSYTWGGGLGTANPLTVSPVATTTYDVTGSTLGCTGSANITVTVTPNPIVSIAASSNTICVGFSTTLTANGSTTYLWSGGLGTANSITVAPLTTTTYDVTGTTTGCTGTASITIIVNPNPVVSITTSANPICAGTSETLTANGATTYSWSGGLGNANPLTVTPFTTTTYTVTGSTTGCIGTSSITVTVYPIPIVSISASLNPICVGYSSVLTANGAANYLWDNGSGNTSLTVSPMATTTYTVTGTTNGCFGTAEIIVTAVPMPAVYLGNDATICPDIPFILDAGNPGLGMSYDWSTGETTQTIIAANTATYWVVVSNNVCTVSDTINLEQAPYFSLGNDLTLCGLSHVTLQSNITANAFSWSTGSTSSTIIVDQAGTYWLDANYDNCILSDTVDVTGGYATLYVPTGFTPSEDGLNDFFLPKGEGVTEYDLRIFSRWGELIFESNNMNLGWDGKFYNGKPAETGAYVWTIDYKDVCSGLGSTRRIGNVTLVR